MKKNGNLFSLPSSLRVPRRVRVRNISFLLFSPFAFSGAGVLKVKTPPLSFYPEIEERVKNR